jgi:hypothetical protein
MCHKLAAISIQLAAQILHVCLLLTQCAWSHIHARKEEKRRIKPIHLEFEPQSGHVTINVI